MAVAILPSKLQRFLLSVLQDRSLALYTSALHEFKAELDTRGVVWASLAEVERDEWLAEYILEARKMEADGSNFRCCAQHCTKFIPGTTISYLAECWMYGELKNRFVKPQHALWKWLSRLSLWL